MFLIIYFAEQTRQNVYIIAKEKLPIAVWKGLFIQPQLTFSELDSLKIKADIIVVPNLSAMDAAHQDTAIVSWIKSKYTVSTKILTVCDGSLTASVSGIYDGKQITAHASDLPSFKKQFKRPVWVDNVSVTKDGNLYSTAGVASATEGSLLVIKDVFGDSTAKRVMAEINYPYQEIQLKHISMPVSSGNKLTIGYKVLFKRNRRLGTVLEDGIDEFWLAAVMDTYNRTFPYSSESYTVNNQPIITKYGLIAIPTGDIFNDSIDELHITGDMLSTVNGIQHLNTVDKVNYGFYSQGYIINNCLGRIGKIYGRQYQVTVSRLLDYN